MKHRILIEFEASKPLPADFTDVVLNSVYTLDCVDKTECTASLVGDVLKDAEELSFLSSDLLCWVERAVSKGNANTDIEEAYERYEKYYQAAAKDTQ